VTIVHGVDHTSATLRSQSARVTDPSQYIERCVRHLPTSRFIIFPGITV
jgi:hypothetical protein